MRETVGMIYNKPRHNTSDSLDILTQVDAIERSLTLLGYHPVIIPFTKDISLFLNRLKKYGIRMVFNLCETVDEDATLCGHPAAVLELLGIPFTGSPSSSLMISTDKMLTKQIIKSSGVLTPKSILLTDLLYFNSTALRFPVIVKPQFEDASIGIDQHSVFANKQDLNKRLKDYIARFGSVIVEEYILGREFNVSLMGYPALAPLPPAEIDFTLLPKNLYHIVGYRAKWDPSSIEYRYTNRIFPKNLSSLRRRIDITAKICSQLLNIRDYGRVDIRLDHQENIYVLEVNANPCLSPDSGFVAAARESGLSYDQMIEKMIGFVRQRSSGKSSGPKLKNAF